MSHNMKILYFDLPCLHISNSALFFAKCCVTLLLHGHSLNAHYKLYLLKKIPWVKCIWIHLLCPTCGHSAVRWEMLQLTMDSVVQLNMDTLQWRYNGRNGVSNHQPHDCLLRRRSKKASKLRVTGLCVGNSPVTGELPAQRANNAENVSIWWRHHELSSQLFLH